MVKPQWNAQVFICLTSQTEIDEHYSIVTILDLCFEVSNPSLLA